MSSKKQDFRAFYTENEKKGRLIKGTCKAQGKKKTVFFFLFVSHKYKYTQHNLEC